MRKVILLALGIALISISAAVAIRMHHTDRATVARSSAKRPNIVFILTDDQRENEMMAMPETRSLLYAHGVRFTNSFVSDSLCCPSRATILTGLYANHTGVWRNFPPSGGFNSFHDKSTIATWLQPTYTTALIGKYLNNYGAHLHYVPPGWDYWFALNHVAYYNYKVSNNGKPESFGSGPRDYSTNVLATQAVDFIHRTKGPFFLYFAPIAPHRPSTPYPTDQGVYAHIKPWRPPSYGKANALDPPYIRDRVWTHQDMVETDQLRIDMLETLRDADRQIGRVIQALADTGRLHDTLIIFMSDNGWLWGEHRWMKKSVPYEEAIRVPMAMRWDDGGVPAGHAVGQLVNNADIAPTIAQAAGVTPTTRVDGMSLLPLVRGQTTTWRTSFPLEHMVAKYGGPFESGPSYCGVRTEQYMYTRYSGGFQELYNLTKDPYELHNISPKEPALTAQLRALARKECNPPPPGYSWTK
jgi:arylsulfatase A-like enzyme